LDVAVVDALHGLQALAVVVAADERARVVVGAGEVRLRVRLGDREQAGEAALHAVLDVGAGDRGAVLPADVVLELEVPDPVALAGAAGVGGQVAHDLAGGLAGLRAERGERPGGEAADVGLGGGGDALRVQVGRLGAHDDAERPAALRRLRLVLGAGVA